MSREWASFVVLQLLCAVAVSCSSVIPTAPALAAQEIRDAYYFSGELVHLRRSEDQFVVGIVRGRPLPFVVELKFEVSGREFGVVSVRRLTTTDRASVPMSLKSEAVWFVAPVYSPMDGSQRIFPTDELIVRGREGETLHSLTQMPPRGLQVHRLVSGTTDQFVLRLVSPTEQNAVAEARRLFEEGRFVWVEPNFVHERK